MALVGALPILAYASPPDQTWLGGWYDDADFDDVVFSVTSTVAALDHRPVMLGSTLRVLVGFIDAEAWVPTPAAPSPFQGRAPPHS